MVWARYIWLNKKLEIWVLGNGYFHLGRTDSEIGSCDSYKKIDDLLPGVIVSFPSSKLERGKIFIIPLVVDITPF